MIFVFILIMLSGCNQEKNLSDESVILKHVIIQYNKLLANGYRNLNMSRLIEVATEERAKKAFYHMSALGEERKKMDAKQRSISFTNINFISSGKAEVKTREEWDYTHINIDTGEVMSTNSVIYKLKYTVIKKEDRWFVSSIEIENEKEQRD